MKQPAAEKSPLLSTLGGMDACAPPMCAVEDGTAPIPVAYLVHDLADAAVRRRIEVLRIAGAEIRLGGFHRSEQAPSEIGSIVPQPLGRTRDGALLSRVATVLWQWIAPRRLRHITSDARVIVARNLETLVLAARVRKRGQRLVYECLDIHRLLLGQGLASRLLHAVEAWAMRHVDQVVVSAPAFRDHYFRERRRWLGEIVLVENLVPGGSPLKSIVAAPQPPWRIGWFGMLRCRRSLELLRKLAMSHPGKIEVLIAGQPSPDIFPDFTAEIADSPGVTYAGSYRAEHLPDLYGQVHFAWSIDYFEDGLNSAWLLPNRLYESLTYGAVPIALTSVATGNWLARHGVGILIDDPAQDLAERLLALSPQRFAHLRAVAGSIPRDAIIMDEEQALSVGRTMMGLS